jgi:hypothetical protein
MGAAMVKRTLHAASGRLLPLLVLAGVIVAGGALVGAPARATYGAQTTADEPQYLLSAISLAEDRDLDISDELRAERWRDFHQVTLPRQTEPRADGRELSPHDPLFPLLLAVPVAIGGWAGAKVALALMAGLLAAVTLWVAVRRFDVRPTVGAAVVVAFGLAPPLSAYGTQLYPELPAALATMIAVAALTGPLDRRGRVALGLAVVALPWLAVKYAPVAAALAAVALVRLVRRGERTAAVALTAALAVAAAAYLAFHQAVYGGWTVYAAGDHFVAGEFTVVGSSPDYVGRSVRVVGLLIDRGFGLAAWAPVFLVAVVALGAVVRARPAGWPALVVPAAAGWANATWVALTMHGWWWPGRQVVVIVPLLVLVTAWWLDRHPVARPLFAVAALAGLVLWGWLLVEVLQHRVTLIVDFEATRDPLARAWRFVLPDYRQPGRRTWALQAGWFVVLGLLARAGWRSARGDQDPGAGERADADVVTVDLDGGRAVR